MTHLTPAAAPVTTSQPVGLTPGTRHCLKSTLFPVGNPTVGKDLFEQNHAVGLYVPLRIAVYADANGKTYVQYDKPSALLGQFKNEKIAMIAIFSGSICDG